MCNDSFSQLLKLYNVARTCNWGFLRNVTTNQFHFRFKKIVRIAFNSLNEFAEFNDEEN